MSRKKKQKGGPKGRLTAAQQELAAQYVPLARALARPMKATWPMAWEEFESAACLALVEAARTFDPRRKFLFTTYARARILGAMRDVHRRMAKRHAREEAGMRPHFHRLANDPELNLKLYDIHPDPPIGHDLESVEEVERWLARVPARHAAACRLIYVNGLSQVEAAERLGCSQSRLSCLHREALSMLNGSWYPSPDADQDEPFDDENESDFETDDLDQDDLDEDDLDW
jgi:RNA polymerase sigma factor (sigma-70 family)